MPICKKRNSKHTVKSGIVSGKQRYHCKDRGCDFREGDNRTNDKAAAKKALCILLYSMTKGSFRMIGHILGIDRALVYRWIKAFGESLPEPKISGDIRRMEFDGMRRFVGLKKTSFGPSRPLTAALARTVAWVFGHRDTATFKRLLR